MIGIDVGGANLKIVHEKGVDIHYCPLWQESPLTELLKPYAYEKAFVVMSGELADGFSNKMEGIGYIVDSVKEAIPDSLFYGLDASFHEGATPLLAAANWLASADFLRTRFPDHILVDMGSTTTDIIPLNRFDELKGLTDLKRLQKGYLLYTGLLRTTIPAVIASVRINDIETPVSSEHFATTADAHLVAGNIEEKEYTTPTADGRGTDIEHSMRRLSRMVCSDLEEITEEGAKEIANAVVRQQIRSISKTIEGVKAGCETTGILAGGIGAKLIVRELGARDLSVELSECSGALPAYAVLEVGSRTQNSL